ncbi:MAG: hypothetical protein C4534_07860 [Gaiellales bacterium]|nr:MAG: hypothetical protein C4534_07860 [Gaiellales bacterium]
MARLTKYLFGGIVGAALAVLVTPRKGAEMRRLLMGARRPAELPSPPGTMPAPEPQPAAEPAAAAAGTEPVAGAVDLEARIEETRRQVEEQLSEPFAVTETAGIVAAEPEEIVETADAEAPAAPEAVFEVTEPEMPEPVTEAAPEAPVTDAYSFLDEDEGWAPDSQASVEEAATEMGEAAAEEEAAAEAVEEAAPQPAPSPWDDDWVSGPEASPVEEAPAEAVPSLEEETGYESGLEEQLEEAIAAAEAQASGPEDTGEAPLEEADMSYLSMPAEGEPELEIPSLAGEAVEEPTAGQPEAATGEEGSEAQSKPAFDREAMRRRIEETRARLKAKAFDAMVSGESFISTDDEANSEGAGVDLDAESQQAIEQSLREDD